METKSGRVIRREMRTPATPEAVWQALTDPAELARWFVDRAAGNAVTGGTMTWYWDSFGAAVEQDVESAEAPHRLVLGTGLEKWTHLPEEMRAGMAGARVALELRITREAGATVLRIVHSGFLEDASFEDEYEGTSSGWSMALAMLEHYLERHRGQDRVEVLAFRPATFDLADLRNAQRTGSGLARWLTTSGEPRGDAVRLQLKSGRTLTGRVLVETENEVLWSWDELNGVLELKAFGMGGGRWMVGLRSSLWNAPAGLKAALQTELDQAADALVATLSSD